MNVINLLNKKALLSDASLNEINNMISTKTSSQINNLINKDFLKS
jgi:hypothetical protein